MHADASRPRGGLRQWLSGVWAALRNRRHVPPEVTTPPPVLDARITINHTKVITFGTPARGDSYDFLVTAELCWCATGARSQDELLQKIKDRSAEIDAEIKAAARPVARRFVPYRPGDAEQAVGAAMRGAVEAALAAVPDPDGVVLNCTPRVRVDMHDDIKTLQRKYVAEQVEVEARHDRSTLEAERLGELRVVWRDFIADGLPDWKTPYAVSMALQPELSAKLLFALRKDRREEAQGLVETVAQVATGHERLDLLEFAVASDSALRKTYELLGLQLPDAGPDSLFSSPGDGAAP
ncbi:hypothetical protein [Nonomuraea sp. NPDC050540]|uniref:hypothetical protein n=1 Tax=Nonomuraea sp. NPDC050540 TaxID=3364367 RepID=UPI00379075DF